ncbi:hypothetical protein F4802DRAFT_602068 [Xylaria palmicola]|nr:hypothetical protein F4802DRAFT_602068 [Xylaria palmicola]
MPALNFLQPPPQQHQLLPLPPPLMDGLKLAASGIFSLARLFSPPQRQPGGDGGGALAARDSPTDDGTATGVAAVGFLVLGVVVFWLVVEIWNWAGPRPTYYEDAIARQESHPEGHWRRQRRRGASPGEPRAGTPVNYGAIDYDDDDYDAADIARPASALLRPPISAHIITFRL